MAEQPAAVKPDESRRRPGTAKVRAPAGIRVDMSRSSNVAAAEWQDYYDGQDNAWQRGQLLVWFKSGGPYLYPNITYEQWNDFHDADSFGEWVAVHLKDTHKHGPAAISSRFVKR